MKKSISDFLATGMLLVLSGALATPAAAGTIKHKDWQGSCDGHKTCFVQMGDAGPRLLYGWRDVEKAMRLGALVPAQVGLNRPVTVWVDDNASIFLSTNHCTQTHCEAMADARKTGQLVELLKKAGEGVLVYPEGNRLKVSPISLHGFSKAQGAVLRQMR